VHRSIGRLDEHIERPDLILLMQVERSWFLGKSRKGTSE
jgi:hypothetical protein